MASSSSLDAKGSIGEAAREAARKDTAERVAATSAAVNADIKTKHDGETVKRKKEMKAQVFMETWRSSVVAFVFA